MQECNISCHGKCMTSSESTNVQLHVSVFKFALGVSRLKIRVSHLGLGGIPLVSFSTQCPLARAILSNERISLCTKLIKV